MFYFPYLFTNVQTPQKGSGESAQMYKERLWGFCTNVQRKALGSLLNVQRKALGSLHKCTKKASGESAQMYKESLWGVCTNVQRKPLGSLHKCADSPDPFFACQCDCDKVQIRKHSGSTVECLTPDQGVAGLSHTACAVLCPLA